jgi:hypothetical protein
MQIAELPFLDEHTTVVDAPVAAVWAVLLERMDGAFTRPELARLVGCEHDDHTGPRPVAEGSTIPGFLVSTMVPNRELVLEGRHRFSTYALTFRVEPAGRDRTRLRAESRAVFPGVAGSIYRLLVIGTGGHIVAVRRLLASVKRRAEARSRAER